MHPFLIFSDLHVHAHRKDTKRLDDCLRVLEWVFETALKKGIKDVVFLGDLFHDRTRIEINTFHEVYKLFEKYLDKPKFKLWLLLGNHDLYNHDKLDVYSPKFLGGFSGVEVIDQPGTRLVGGSAIDFLPYTHHPIDDLKTLASVSAPAGQKKILGTHLAVDGARLNSFGTLSDVIVEHEGEMVKIAPELFSPWDKVWSGHYHGTQVLGNFEYVGSPLELTRSETRQQKHLVLFHPDTLKTEYIINDFSPVHLILDPGDLDKHKLDGNFITLNVSARMPSVEIADIRRKIIAENKVGSLEVKIVKEETKEQVVIDAKAIMMDEKKMLERYVEQTLEYGMDRTTCLSVGNLICQQATDGMK